jgi:hypothetical protein
MRESEASALDRASNNYAVRGGAEPTDATLLSAPRGLLFLNGWCARVAEWRAPTNLCRAFSSFRPMSDHDERKESVMMRGMGMEMERNLPFVSRLLLFALVSVRSASGLAARERERELGQSAATYYGRRRH